MFISKARLRHILDRGSKGDGEPDGGMVHNLVPDIKVVCRHSAVNPFTFHDLRRWCITNWWKKLLVQMVKHLTGHSSIETMRKYYLSVQQSDLNAARQVQSELITSVTNCGQDEQFLALNRNTAKHKCFTAKDLKYWARKDLNLRPMDYEYVAWLYSWPKNRVFLQ